MMNHATLTQLRTLKLFGFAAALEEQAAQPKVQSLSFEERLALLVDRESYLRDERKRTRLLQRAKLKYAQAAIEDLDARPGRGIDRSQFLALALSDRVARGDTLRLTGVSGNPIIPSCGNRIVPAHRRPGGNDGSGRSAGRWRDDGDTRQRRRWQRYRVRNESGQGERGDRTAAVGGDPRASSCRRQRLGHRAGTRSGSQDGAPLPARAVLVPVPVQSLGLDAAGAASHVAARTRVCGALLGPHSLAGTVS